MKFKMENEEEETRVTLSWAEIGVHLEDVRISINY